MIPDNACDSLEQLLHKKKVILVLGAGGVGKTTTSLALSFKAASMGLRVGLLSIDPAKRLATALGMPLSGELKVLELQGLQYSGTIAAAMLDQSAVFMSMIDRYAPSAKIASKIKDHPFSQVTAGNVGGALEYMAVAKLAQMVEAGIYDLIVIDTPPDLHALDFLERPNILSRFFDNNVLGWLLRPFAIARKLGLDRFMSAGEKMLGKIASVTGFKALELMADFLIMVKEVLEGFRTAGSKVSQILKSADACFAIVCSPRVSAERAAEDLVDKLGELSYRVELLVVNRMLPFDVRAELSEATDLRCQGAKYLRERYQYEAQVEAKLLAHLNRNELVEVYVPEQPEDLLNAKALDCLAQTMVASSAVEQQKFATEREEP